MMFTFCKVFLSNLINHAMNLRRFEELQNSPFVYMIYLAFAAELIGATGRRRAGYDRRPGKDRAGGAFAEIGMIGTGAGTGRCETS